VLEQLAAAAVAELDHRDAVLARLYSSA
jgi:hypothetical protein